MLVSLIISLFVLNIQANSYANNYKIEFGKIDNQVVVLLGDSAIYKSDPFEGNPDLDIVLDLSEFSNISNQLTIKLLNGTDMLPSEKDQHWEIRYSLMKNNEEIDFQWESADDFKKGVVFKKSYQLD